MIIKRPFTFIETLLLLLSLMFGAMQMAQFVAKWDEIYTLTTADGHWRSSNDFIAHWTAGTLANAGQAAAAYDATQLKQAYDLHFDMKDTDAVWGHLYPPTAFLLERPIAALPYPLAALIFFTLSTLLYLSAAYRWGGVCGAAVAFAFGGLWIGLNAGQVGMLVAGFLGWCLALIPAAPKRAGMVLSLLVFKPQFAVLFPALLLAQRAFKTFTVASLGVVLWVSLSLILDGTIAWQTYMQEGVKTAHLIMATQSLWSRFLNVYGLLSLAHVQQNLALAMHIVSALMAAMLAILVWQDNRISYAYKAAVACFASLLIMPLSYDYDLPLAMIGLICWFKAGTVRWWGQLLAILFFLLPSFYFTEVDLTAHILLMPLVLWFLLLSTTYHAHTEVVS